MSRPTGGMHTNSIELPAVPALAGMVARNRTTAINTPGQLISLLVLCFKLLPSWGI